MINEDLVEQAALAILQDQGILYLSADVMALRLSARPMARFC